MTETTYHEAMSGRTIAENLMRCSDQELIAMLPYIRDENGERVSLVELKHYLRESNRGQRAAKRI